MATDPRRTFYAGIADEFDAIMNRYDLRRRLEVIFDDLLPPDLSGLQLLDVGSGTGWFSKRAMESGAVVTSLDIGESLVRRTLSRAAVNPIVGDALALPFQRNCFDLVVSSEVIEHTVNPAQAIGEMSRVLKARGFLALTCPNRIWKWSVSLANLAGIRPYEGYENFPGFLQLRNMVRGAGLRVLKHRGLHPWPYQIAGLNALSRQVDSTLGRGLIGALMINQAILGQKLPPDR